MCEAVERVVRERERKAERKKGLDIAQRMLADGILSLEKIAQYSSIPLDEIQRLAAEMPQ